MAELSLQQIYNEVMARTQVDVMVDSESDFNNLRTALLRKFRTSRETMLKCGFTWRYEDVYIAARLDRETSQAVFVLAEAKKRKTRSTVLKEADL